MNENKKARSAAALVIGVTAALVIGVTAAIALAGGLTESLKEKSNGHVKTVDYATGTAGKSDHGGGHVHMVRPSRLSGLR